MAILHDQALREAACPATALEMSSPERKFFPLLALPLTTWWPTNEKHEINIQAGMRLRDPLTSRILADMWIHTTVLASSWHCDILPVNELLHGVAALLHMTMTA